MTLTLTLLPDGYLTVAPRTVGSSEAEVVQMLNGTLSPDRSNALARELEMAVNDLMMMKCAGTC